MSRAWTAEQIEAIETTDTCLLVSAAAGTGKTAVLVERVIRRLTDPIAPVDVDRLLVVTFTEAAAHEVRARVREALHREVAARPELQGQLALVDRAWISTLHSFCLRLLRKHFYLLELDPLFRVAGEEEALLLRLQAIDEVFESRYDRGTEAFLDLVAAYAGPGGDRRLKRLVLDLHAFAVTQPDPEGWLAAAARAFRVPEGWEVEDLPWAGALLETARLELGRAAGLLEAAARLAVRPGGPGTWLDVLLEEAAAVRAAAAGLDRGWEAARELVGSLAFGRLPAHRGEVDPAVKEQAQGLRDEARGLVRKLKTTCFDRSSEEMVAELRALADRMDCLVDLTLEFDRHYAAVKAAGLLLDFSDLERYCLRLLRRGDGPSAVAAELRETFHEVLVDEYQDINPLQDAILELVSRGPGDPRPNLFMVGDVKQSIYRFRMAAPALFLSRYRAYPTQPGLPCRRLPLSVNHRSRPELLHAVNFLFRQLMTEGVGELAYDREAELKPARGPVAESLPVEVHLVERGHGDDEDASEPLEAVEREARVIARRIRQLVAADPPELLIADASGPRRPRYRDFAVLLRATRGQANLVMETLRLEGVPACGELATGYFQAAEVQVMLALLRLLDNPRQDIPLACVLRSPLVGLGPAELVEVRLGATGDFWDAVQASGDVRVRKFRERLERWRTLARRGPLADLLATVYRETGYCEYVGAMPGGAQRQANLQALHDRARAFDRYAARGLVSFLGLLEGLEEAEEDLGAAVAVGEEEDAVRVMSVHRSKGLEFPVVFLADLGRRFRLVPDQPDLLFHRQLGLGPAVVDTAAQVVYPSLAQRAVLARLRLESLAEEMRILYVAMTRARDHLVLVGSVRGLERALTAWQAVVAGHRDWPLPDALLAGASTPLEWMGMALARHPRLARDLPEADCLPADEAAHFELVLWKSVPPGRSVWRPDESSEPRPTDVPSARRVACFERSLNWRYPYPALARAAAKVAVTELKGRTWPQEEEDAARVPVSAAPGPGLEAGTATHLVLRHLALDRLLDAEDVGRQIADMVRRELVSAEAAALVDRASISRFFAGPLGSRLRSAGARVWREVAFTLAVPAEEVHPWLPLEQARGEQVLVQGVIDCLVEVEDGLMLVDFKTDRVGAGGLTALAERYAPQLRLYARAAATILRRPVVRACLHFLSADATVEVPLP